MANFSVVGEIDPFLSVELNQGDSIFAESGAMVTMDSTLDLKGRAVGGLGAALMRTFANSESIFQQSIVASRGNGQVLLSPELPGSVELLKVGKVQYRLNDGAFVASDTSVQIVSKAQSFGRALFGGSGGFFVMETSGQGTVAISGFGTIFELDVDGQNELLIDNAHVVAWDSTLEYDLSVSTSQGGFFSNLLNSAVSGEGIITKFRGHGKVYVCSRNRQAFLGWLASKISASNSSH